MYSPGYTSCSDCLPETGPLPLQEPDALQRSAFVAFQVNVVDCPDSSEVGAAVSVSTGAARLPPPPPPHALKTNAVNAHVANLTSRLNMLYRRGADATRPLIFWSESSSY